MKPDQYRSAMAKAVRVKELIGARMQALRKAKGLTQEELAEEVGISDKYLSSIECGQENPTLDTLLKLAGALDAPIWEFFQIQDTALTPEDRSRMAREMLKRASPKQVSMVIRLLREIGIK